MNVSVRKSASPAHHGQRTFGRPGGQCIMQCHGDTSRGMKWSIQNDSIQRMYAPAAWRIFMPSKAMLCELPPLCAVEPPQYGTIAMEDHRRVLVPLVALPSPLGSGVRKREHSFSAASATRSTKRLAGGDRVRRCVSKSIAAQQRAERGAIDIASEQQGFRHPPAPRPLTYRGSCMFFSCSDGFLDVHELRIW